MAALNLNFRDSVELLLSNDKGAMMMSESCKMKKEKKNMEKERKENGHEKRVLF